MTYDELVEKVAIVSRLPYSNGDGYNYGGEVILTIGDQSFLIGAGTHTLPLAAEMARRWNAMLAASPLGEPQ